MQPGEQIGIGSRTTVNRVSRQSMNLKNSVLISRSHSLSKHCGYIADLNRSLVNIASTRCGCSIRPASEREEID
jgi:hypothetical protein